MRYTLQDFQAEYPADEACLDKIMVMRYGQSPMCPGCGAETKFHRITKRRAYACQHCGHHVYPCVGTPFDQLREGQTVTMTVGQGPKGPRAENVQAE